MEVSRGAQRKTLLQERDDRIVEFMQQNRPVAVIAELEGLEEFYCRKATRRLAEERGIEYQPDKDSGHAGLMNEASRALRSNLANILHDYRNKPGRHPLEVARDTGLTQAQQVQATERGGRHDWKISQLERLAQTTGLDFNRLLVIAAFKPTSINEKVREQEEIRYRRILACLNN